MAYQVRTVPLETRNRAAIPDRPKRSSLSPTRHSVFHAIRFLRALRVVKTVQRSDKVTCDTADALLALVFSHGVPKFAMLGADASGTLVDAVREQRMLDFCYGNSESSPD